MSKPIPLYRHEGWLPQLAWQLINNMPLLAGQVAEQCGGFGLVSFAGNKIALASDPTINALLLHKDNRQFLLAPPQSSAYRYLLGEYSLPLLPMGDLWKYLRKLIAAQLNYDMISKHYVQAIGEEAASVVDNLHEGQQVDLHALCVDLTLSITMRILAGDHGMSDLELKALPQAVTTADKFLKWKGVMKAAAYGLVPKYLEYRQAVREVHAIIDRLIARAKKRDNGTSLLDIMIAEQKVGNLSDQQVRDTMLAMFMAGFETTAESATTELVQLSANEEALSKLRAELGTRFRNALPTGELLKQLPYNRAAATEAVRWHTPVPVFGGQASQNMDVGGYWIEGGTVILIDVLSVHHDSRWFIEPSLYMPERFIDADKSVRDAYMGFSHGPKVCVGNTLAPLEMEIIAAVMLSRASFQLSAINNYAMDYAATIRHYKHPVMATVHKH